MNDKVNLWEQRGTIIVDSSGRMVANCGRHFITTKDGFFSNIHISNSEILRITKEIVEAHNLKFAQTD